MDTQEKEMDKREREAREIPRDKSAGATMEDAPSFAKKRQNTHTPFCRSHFQKQFGISSFFLHLPPHIPLLLSKTAGERKKKRRKGKFQFRPSPLTSPRRRKRRRRRSVFIQGDYFQWGTLLGTNPSSSSSLAVSPLLSSSLGRI